MVAPGAIENLQNAMKAMEEKLKAVEEENATLKNANTTLKNENTTLRDKNTAESKIDANLLDNVRQLNNVSTDAILAQAAIIEALQGDRTAMGTTLRSFKKDAETWKAVAGMLGYLNGETVRELSALVQGISGKASGMDVLKSLEEVVRKNNERVEVALGELEKA
jgi:septal ring factor EnvC (AmiA/AmiB activator)